MSKKNCVAAFFLVLILFLTILLHVIGFFSFLGGVCNWVPNDRAYCTEKKDEKNNIITSKEQDIYLPYQWLTGFSILSEIIAFYAVCSRVFCCVECCCVPCCYTCWKCCFPCGNAWIIALIIGVVIAFVKEIMIGATLPTADLAPHIMPFRCNLASFLLGVLLIFGWTVYVGKYGCPPEGYFLGSNKVFSDYAVKTKKEEQTWSQRYADGRVKYWTQVWTCHELVWIGNSNKVEPLSSSSHM